MTCGLQMSGVEVTNGIRDLLLPFTYTTPNGVIKSSRIFTLFLFHVCIYVLLKNGDVVGYKVIQTPKRNITQHKNKYSPSV